MSRSLNHRLFGTTSADCIHTFTAEGIDPDTGALAPIDLTDLAIVFVVKSKCGAQRWKGEVDDGITADLPDSGQFTVWIPVGSMGSICPGEYDIGCTLADDIVTTQFLLGTLSIRNGVV